MNKAIEKYAGLFDGLDALKSVTDASDASSYLLTGEDDDALALAARIVAARLCGIGYETAVNGHADISVYPLADKAQKVKKSDAKTEKTEKKKPTVSVDDVRAIIDSLSLTPFELDKRVYIIENAESMSEICQNKLLKSLEEPPPRVRFVLCASGAVLPTVESRCRTIHLAPLPLDVVREQLTVNHKTADARAIDLAVRASRGNIGVAEKVLGDAEYSKSYETALSILRTATGSNRFAHVAALYDKASRDRVDGILGVMESLLGDVARLLVGAETVYDNSDINSAAIGFTPLSAANCCEFVRDAKRRNAANCMPQAVMDRLVLKIMEEKALCRRS